MEQRLGKYEIRGILGKGAMGTVYDARDPVIDRRVAIKTITLPDPSDTEAQDELERFKREAQAAGRLTHRNIVGVFDYGETDTLAYIVMEFVDGNSLKGVMEKQERFPVAETVRVMEALLEGLQFSHERGVVHRDIKPANVMITLDGQVKIADFGIARIESSSMTQAGTIMGTPAYMSPEQFMGQTVDARTDIYSAGVVLYQMLTGERPFEGSMTAIMHKALNTTPPRPSELSVTAPAALDEVVAKAMAKRPEQRFASANEFAQALRAAGKGDAVDTLLDEILRQRGAAYRHDRLAALLARDDRDGLLALQWIAAGDTDAAVRELAAAGATRLVERYGDDVDALYVLALGCSTGSIPCMPDIFARLTARAPDNAVHWILAPADEAPLMTRERLRQAARAPRFDDHLAAQTALLRATLAPTTPPPELGEPLQGVLDTAEVGPSLRRRAIEAVPLPRYAAVVGLCRPDRAPAATDAALRADCDAFGRLALDAPDAAILSRMIASAILRRLHPDDAIGRKAYGYRRQYVWLSEQFVPRGLDAEQLQQDVARYGEWEAWLRQADRSHVARRPPDDWQPKNPQALLLAEQRKP